MGFPWDTCRLEANKSAEASSFMCGNLHGLAFPHFGQKKLAPNCWGPVFSCGLAFLFGVARGPERTDNAGSKDGEGDTQRYQWRYFRQSQHVSNEDFRTDKDQNH